MKQFAKILKFELKNYFTNKVFVGVTLFLVAAISVTMFFPNIKAQFDGSSEDNSETANVKTETMLIKDAPPAVTEAFRASFTDFAVLNTNDSVDEIKEKISSGEADCAFVITGDTSYTYYVGNLSMYDANTAVADEILQTVYQMNAMITNGISPEQAGAIMNVPITGTVENIGKDQMQNFFYTYIMIFALYMVILLYGQMVATNVATEKSSRAMELLITSAKPTSMMFGKVIASCLAGLIQLIAVFGSAFLFYNINKAQWGENEIVKSIFNIPLELLIYMLLFFVLGFLIYAFLYGAIGSMATKLEDINTSSMPLTFLFIIAFMVVMFSMASGSVDNTAMIICSYVPFTSPMAMFTRIAMSTVPWYEILISVIILIGSTIGVGVLSAKIYRVGVLLYGTPPKISAIIKALKKS